jgi:protein SCO1/2
MPEVVTAGALSEPQFAELVDSLAADPDRREQLTHLLREDHPLYDQRGTATISRMRGWVLLAFARVGLSEAALIFVLEELDTGTDAYLVAAAAHALRSYPRPHAALAPFVMRALDHIRYREEPVSFENYGEYADSSGCTSPVRELLSTLSWLGPHARGVLSGLEALRAERGRLSKQLLIEVDRTIESIRDAGHVDEIDNDNCCNLPSGLGNAFSWAFGSRRGCEPIEKTVFEDHQGTSITFKEFFRGHPSIVVFFYTRCDNPLKCSLTVTKLARIQTLLEAHGLADQIHTAAISYDPAFDLPERIRGYGQNRGVRLNASHRMLRTTDGSESLRRHFKLGVNFIESLVNRHRLEVYILDREGRIAASFERIHWDEEEVVARAIEVLSEPPALAGGSYEQAALASGPCEQTALASGVDPLDLIAHGGETNPAEPRPNQRRQTAPTVFSTLASLGVAFFPKCPVCWAGYMSMFGIASLEQIPYAPWLQPVFVVVMLINLISVWIRGRSTGRMLPFYLVSAGALTIVASKWAPGIEKGAVWGVALTFAGSMLSALSATKGRSPVNDWLAQIWRKRYSIFRPSR